MIKLKKENFLESFKEQYDIEYLKEHFKNVYFIIGTAYAGKSTILKMLSEYYDGIHCKENYGLDYLKEYNVNNKSHPCLCYFNNHSMQDFVNRNPDEYYNWLRGSEIEITPIEIEKLLEITKENPNKKVFVDTSIPMELLKLISSYDNVAVMLSEKSMSVDRFFDRPDPEKNQIYKAIMESENPEKTMENYRKGLEKANSIERYNFFLNSGFYVFKRDDSLSLEQTMDVIANHFKLDTKIIKK